MRSFSPGAVATIALWKSAPGLADFFQSSYRLIISYVRPRRKCQLNCVISELEILQLVLEALRQNQSGNDV